MGKNPKLGVLEVPYYLEDIFVSLELQLELPHILFEGTQVHV